MSLTPPGASATSFGFDALGRHASRVTPGGTDAYEYVATSETVWRITTAGIPTSSALDPSGARLATAQSGTTGYLLPDLHGNLAAVVNAGETALLSATRYDAFGLTAAAYDAGGSFPTPWRFQGRLDVSPDTHPLYAAGARFYDPAIGAFTQLDTYAGSPADPLSLNRFAYAEANPWTLVDPSGHRPCPDVVCDTVVDSSKPPPPEPPQPPGPVPEGPALGQSAADPFIYVVVNPAAFEGPAPCVAGTCPTTVPLPRDPRYSSFGTHVGLGGCASVPVYGWPCDLLDAGLSLAEGDVPGFFISLLGTISIGDSLRAARQGERKAAMAAGHLALDTDVLIFGLEKGQIAAVDAALAGRTPVVSPQAAREFLRQGDRNVLRNFLVERGGRIGPRANARVLDDLEAQAELIGRIQKLSDRLVAGSAVREGITLLTNDKRFYSWLREVGYDAELWTP